MRNSAEIAAIRFGEGLSPSITSPKDADAVLRQLRGLDTLTTRFPIARYADLAPQFREIGDKRKRYREASRQGGANEGAEKEFRSLLRQFNRDRLLERRAILHRGITTDAPFRERLTRFWADHFTVVGKNATTRNLVAN